MKFKRGDKVRSKRFPDTEGEVRAADQDRYGPYVVVRWSTAPWAGTSTTVEPEQIEHVDG